MDTDSKGKHFLSKRIDFVGANSLPESVDVRFLTRLIRVHQRPSVVPTELFGLRTTPHPPNHRVHEIDPTKVVIVSCHPRLSLRLGASAVRNPG